MGHFFEPHRSSHATMLALLIHEGFGVGCCFSSWGGFYSACKAGSISFLQSFLLPPAGFVKEKIRHPAGSYQFSAPNLYRITDPTMKRFDHGAQARKDQSRLAPSATDTPRFPESSSGNAPYDPFGNVQLFDQTAPAPKPGVSIFDRVMNDPVPPTAGDGIILGSGSTPATIIAGKKHKVTKLPGRSISGDWDLVGLGSGARPIEDIELVREERVKQIQLRTAGGVDWGAKGFLVGNIRVKVKNWMGSSWKSAVYRVERDRARVYLWTPSRKDDIHDLLALVESKALQLDDIPKPTYLFDVHAFMVSPCCSFEKLLTPFIGHELN